MRTPSSHHMYAAISTTLSAQVTRKSTTTASANHADDSRHAEAVARTSRASSDPAMRKTA